MPRDGIADEIENAIDPLTALPAWVKGEKRLSMMLPYVSLVNDRTIRTRGNELMQCIRLEGVNSTTSEDGHLDRIGGLLAGIVAQVGTEFSFYLHKVSKAVDVTLPPVPGEGFAAAVDKRWHAHLGRASLRDKTLTLTVLKRPEASSRLPFGLGASRSRHAADTTRRLRKLDEVVGFLLSSFDELKPRPLAASTGELLGFLGSLNTGEESPLFPRSRLGVIAEDVANTRVTFRGTTIALSDGAVGDKLGAIFAVKNYPAKTDSLMLDELNLPVDMVVTHSFVPINANIMAGRIKRQLRLMQAANDGAVSLAQELELAQDDLESKRLIFGEHHMTVAVYARTQTALDDIAAEIRNISATSGINLISEAFGARAHFMAQHPGNTGARSRKAAITNHNFTDLATFHRTPLGKTGREVPWGVPITLFPTPERSGFRFNFHEQGAPDREPTGGHTLILGRPGSGKSVLAAFLMTMARRAGARVFVFDYRAGMEMAVRALGGSYSTVRAGRPTGLNPLQTEIDMRGQAWLADWLASLLERRDRPLTPVQTNRLQEVVRQNASAGHAGLRNWSDFASLLVSTDDEGDLFERMQEWTAEGRYGWIFGANAEDSFSIDGDVAGFDLTGILDSESERERMAVLSYLFRRVERVIEDRKPTIIVIDEAWKALDNAYFAERLSNWLVTARKQNAVVVMMTQYASQLERTRTGKTIVEAVPTQVLLPNIRASAADYAMLGLTEKELDVLLGVGSASRLALVRDDRGSVVIDADLSALGPLVTILGGMEKGEALVGADYRERPDFWRVT
ncbi:type IV secretion system protein VirB4 [Celeribacter baekdonensis]|jgi:type IV secretion system protein VirB4|uniref:Type IV secretion system protein B4 n=5 Tax=Roseobacteraceae TaxID=2854170 RepID=A0A291GJ40_9RHOB|nr:MULTISPECIES: type IV secretion system protein B4 [Roseobacteraceae]AUJ66021.1 type IV secretion system protein B4 [Aestuarium zhoushanense]AJE49435.1 type IV secretion system protein VirB [Celeribacter indicus]ATG50004.1 type IV secretion system protein B4 [Celeribacter ethanolicus]MDF1803523.1 type IV secretion system protein B4 [Thalassovita sp.]PTQ67145.1 type IV secretion system protein VirB4 [Celeribacter persicus]